MQIAVLYLSTAAIFLILDAIMLTLVMKPLFSRHIGPLMLTDIRMVPAAAFYAAYVAGLIYLVSYPALKAGGAGADPGGDHRGDGLWDLRVHLLCHHERLALADGGNRYDLGHGADGVVGLGRGGDHAGGDGLSLGKGRACGLWKAGASRHEG
jgi:hypothetical protein